MISNSTEVLVCGSGLAGHCAALAAAEGGAEVLFVEKTDFPGGSSVQAGGGFAFAGTDLQAARGIADGADQLRRDLTEAGGGKGNPALIETYVANQLETYEWLRANGVEFSLGTLPPPAPCRAFMARARAPQWRLSTTDCGGITASAMSRGPP